MLKELDYSLERKDVLKFLCFHQYKRISLLIIVTISFLLFLYTFIKNTNIVSGIIFIICTTCFILFVFSPYIGSLRHKKIDINIILDSDKKAFIVNALTRVEFNWDHILNVYNTKNNFLIYIEKNNAFIIPKRIFKDEQEINETWNLIQECYNKNKVKKKEQ